MHYLLIVALCTMPDQVTLPAKPKQAPELPQAMLPVQQTEKETIVVTVTEIKPVIVYPLHQPALPLYQPYYQPGQFIPY